MKVNAWRWMRHVWDKALERELLLCDSEELRSSTDLDSRNHQLRKKWFMCSLNWDWFVPSTVLLTMGRWSRKDGWYFTCMSLMSQFLLIARQMPSQSLRQFNTLVGPRPLNCFTHISFKGRQSVFQALEYLLCKIVSSNL
jgi:hypothetical protein